MEDVPRPSRTQATRARFLGLVHEMEAIGCSCHLAIQDMDTAGQVVYFGLSAHNAAAILEILKVVSNYRAKVIQLQPKDTRKANKVTKELCVNCIFDWCTDTISLDPHVLRGAQGSWTWDLHFWGMRIEKIGCWSIIPMQMLVYSSQAKSYGLYQVFAVHLLLDSDVKDCHLDKIVVIRDLLVAYTLMVTPELTTVLKLTAWLVSHSAKFYMPHCSKPQPVGMTEQVFAAARKASGLAQVQCVWNVGGKLSHHGQGLPGHHSKGLC